MVAARPVRFRRGQTLWERGGTADHVIAPCVGVLRLAVPRGDRFATLDLVTRGDYCGEEAVFSNQRRPAYCFALSDGRGLAFPTDCLQSVICQRPGALTSLTRQALTRCYHFTEHVGDGVVEVKDRLARAILDLVDKFGLPDARGVFVPIHLTRGDLADLVGCRVETAIRCLAAWEREGVLLASREGLVIMDRAALAGGEGTGLVAVHAPDAGEAQAGTLGGVSPAARPTPTSPCSAAASLRG